MDSPKSPCSIPEAHLKYCTNQGLSVPKRARSRARSSAVHSVAPVSPTSLKRAGSPGSTRISEKIRIEASINVGIKSNSLFTT